MLWLSLMVELRLWGSAVVWALIRKGLNVQRDPSSPESPGFLHMQCWHYFSFSVYLEEFINTVIR